MDSSNPSYLATTSQIPRQRQPASNLVAGDTKVLTEKFVIAYDTSKVE